jgi:hypothetical protein
MQLNPFVLVLLCAVSARPEDPRPPAPVASTAFVLPCDDYLKGLQ